MWGRKAAFRTNNKSAVTVNSSWRKIWFILASFNKFTQSYCCSSVTQFCLTLCDPMNCSIRGLPVLCHLLEFAQTHVHWVDDAIQPSHPLLPLLLLYSIFPSIRVFASESTLCIRWPKYWSLSFSICPSSEHSGLISFRMDWLDLLVVQRTLKSLLQHHSLKTPFLWNWSSI